MDIEEGVSVNQTNQVPANQTGLIPALPETSELIDAVPREYGAFIGETMSIPKQTEQIRGGNYYRSTASTTTINNFRVNGPYHMMIMINNYGIKLNISAWKRVARTFE